MTHYKHLFELTPCRMHNCEYWDSDENGGHCMLVERETHYNPETNQVYCANFRQERKTPD